MFLDDVDLDYNRYVMTEGRSFEGILKSDGINFESVESIGSWHLRRVTS